MPDLCFPLLYPGSMKYTVQYSLYLSHGRTSNRLSPVHLPRFWKSVPVESPPDYSSRSFLLFLVLCLHTPLSHSPCLRLSPGPSELSSAYCPIRLIPHRHWPFPLPPTPQRHSRAQSPAQEDMTDRRTGKQLWTRKGQFLLRYHHTSQEVPGTSSWLHREFVQIEDKICTSEAENREVELVGKGK